MQVKFVLMIVGHFMWYHNRWNSCPSWDFSTLKLGFTYHGVI